MKHRIVLAAGIILCMAAGAFAQTPAKGLQGDLVGQLKDAGAKLVALAETMTQEQYAWRPAEGVRSVGEVYMHAAGANVLFLGIIGVESPLKIDQAMETSVTDKAQIIEMLKKSFKFAEESVAKVKDADLGKAVKVFGRDGTYRSVLVLIATHAHEHVGQSVAYARMNKVAPPWSKGGGM